MNLKVRNGEDLEMFFRALRIKVLFSIKSILNARQAALGYLVSRRLVQKYPGKEILFTFFSIGDTVLMLSFLRAYQNQYSVDFVAVVSEYTKSIAEAFCFQEDEIAVIDKNDIEKLVVFFGRRGGMNYASYTKYGKILKPVTQLYYMGRHNLLDQIIEGSERHFSYSDITKRIYGIPDVTMPAECQRLGGRELVRKLKREGKLPVGRTVLINPYADTYKMVPISFFQKIADTLVEKGFIVLTSIYGDQKALERSWGIRFSLDEALTLADECKAVVGLRSGFMDFISFSDTAVVCIDFEAYPCAPYWKLEDCWRQNEYIKTFYWQKKRESELVAGIIATISEEIRINH